MLLNIPVTIQLYLKLRRGRRWRFIMTCRVQVQQSEMTLLPNHTIGEKSFYVDL